jgi:hypothetical protein
MLSVARPKTQTATVSAARIASSMAVVGASVTGNAGDGGSEMPPRFTDRADN